MISDNAPVELSRHAIQRFQARVKLNFGVRLDWEEAIQHIVELLAEAEVYEPDTARQWAHLAQRTHKARLDGKTVEYWTTEGWRFVVSRWGRNEPRTLVTCERINPEENYEEQGMRI